MVYQFKCNELSCQANYIGYTTNRLITRAKQHRYNPSKIFKHFNDDHKTAPSKQDDYFNQFTILYRNNIKRNIQIAEALLIKKNNPYINIRYHEMDIELKIFK